MKQKKKASKLSGRIKDWNDTITRLKSNTGGYHKPGSTKK